jgi:aspartyl-tRNA(Asn)/glutamyl-tRNA(Gln) amidotransferase subunit B
VISEEWLEQITAAMPALPQALREKFTQVYGIPVYDALVLTDTREMAQYFEDVCAKTSAYKAASNWLMGSVKSYVNDHDGNIEAFPVSAQTLAELIELTETNVISNSVATQKIFPILLNEPTRSPKEIATTNNWIQNSNTNELETLVDQVIASCRIKWRLTVKGKKACLDFL